MPIPSFNDELLLLPPSYPGVPQLACPFSERRTVNFEPVRLDRLGERMKCIRYFESRKGTPQLGLNVRDCPAVCKANKCNRALSILLIRHRHHNGPLYLTEPL